MLVLNHDLLFILTLCSILKEWINLIHIPNHISSYTFSKEMILYIFLLSTFLIQSTTSSCTPASLLPSQYTCMDATIDNYTQAAVNCTLLRFVEVPCFPRMGVKCGGTVYDGFTIGFYKNVTCRYVKGRRDYGIALGLSVFFGFLGLDRFYLGYVAIGFLKLSTVGFFLLGHLIDIILIALQIVGPADQSDYYTGYWGPTLERVTVSEQTVFA